MTELEQALEVNVDDAVRLRALNGDESFIVQAPAGSGKTSLLVQRYLSLLAKVQKYPEECLAITFTRQAAFEMRERVITLLEWCAGVPEPQTPFDRLNWRLGRQVLKRDKDSGWSLLEVPHRFKIQTIDALCLSIIQQMPVASPITQNSQMSENASLIYQKASIQLIRYLETNDAYSQELRILLKHLDNHIPLAVDLFSTMLSRRDQWLPFMGGVLSREAIQTVLNQSLEAAIVDRLERLKRALPQDFLELQQLFEEVQACQLSTSSVWSALQYWQKFADFVLTEQGGIRKTVTARQGFPAPSSTTDKVLKELYHNRKQRLLGFLETLKDEPRFQEALIWIRACPAESYAPQQMAVLKSLLVLLPLLVAECQYLFEQEGEMDFTEVALTALRGLEDLGEPTELALNLDCRIRHILVDEFQDTSFTQYRLLECLTVGWERNDGRTLFLVGDPMQSIYRFRQAEVGLFLRSQHQGLGGVPLHPLYLSANFRCAPSILNWVNQTFEKRFPAFEDEWVGAVPFRAASALTKPSEQQHCHIYTLSQEEETKRVLQELQGYLQAYPTDSVAILVRSRRQLHQLVPALKAAGIAFQGIDLELLANRPVIQDLVAITNALLHLGNRIAWLSLLRMPWCRLTLEDLYHISEYQLDRPLWYSLQRYREISNLSEHAYSVLERLVQALTRAFEELREKTLRTCVSNLWERLGGVQHLYDLHSLEDAQTFLDLLETEDLFYWMEVGVLEARLQTLYAAPDLSGISIMTIHKAKGLEFDTVFVLGVGKRVRGDRNPLLLWSEWMGVEQAHVLMAPYTNRGGLEDPIYAYLKAIDRQKAAYEQERLWYVAATRAKKRLVWIWDESA